MSHDEEPDRNSDRSHATPSFSGDPTLPPSSKTPSSKTLAHATRTNQIVCGALIQGIVMIVGVFWFIGDDAKMDESATVFLLVGGLVFVGTTVASFVAPSLIRVHSALDRSDELANAIATVDNNEVLPTHVSSLMAGYATQSLAVAAFLEGGAVVNSVLWLLSGSVFHLLFVGLAVALMVIRFPTTERLRDFLVANTREE